MLEDAIGFAVCGFITWLMIRRMYRPSRAWLRGDGWRFLRPKTELWLLTLVSVGVTLGCSSAYFFVGYEGPDGESQMRALILLQLAFGAGAIGMVVCMFEKRLAWRDGELWVARLFRKPLVYHLADVVAVRDDSPNGRWELEFADGAKLNISLLFAGAHDLANEARWHGRLSSDYGFIDLLDRDLVDCVARKIWDPLRVSGSRGPWGYDGVAARPSASHVAYAVGLACEGEPARTIVDYLVWAERRLTGAINPDAQQRAWQAAIFISEHGSQLRKQMQAMDRSDSPQFHPEIEASRSSKAWVLFPAAILVMAIIAFGAAEIGDREPSAPDQDSVVPDPYAGRSGVDDAYADVKAGKPTQLYSYVRSVRPMRSITPGILNCDEPSQEYAGGAIFPLIPEAVLDDHIVHTDEQLARAASARRYAAEYNRAMFNLRHAKVLIRCPEAQLPE